MPQGRRKVPFSAKQKKIQLLEKRERKREQEYREGRRKRYIDKVGSTHVESSEDDILQDVSKAPESNRGRMAEGKTNRYKLQFKKETKEELERRMQETRQPIEPVSEELLEVDMNDVFLPGSELDIPKRPPWDYSLSKEQLDSKENKYFREYVSNIEKKFYWDDLSYFELNLETWRQLWRVLEMSDVILNILDIRFPALLFSPALYDYVVKELKKDIIIVLNKIDLAPLELTLAWKHYFQDKFPEAHILCFTSFPGSSVRGDPGQVVHKKRRRGLLKMAARGAKCLLEVCDKIVAGKVDLSSWIQKIEEELADIQVDSCQCEVPVTVEKADTSYLDHERFNDGILTIGCVGHPNVGKSSLINGLMGKKVVSVSRTPGHTKHFQTIFITPTVKLCDCPGLVFPSKVPKSLQILTGSYPIAQVREPYTSVKFLAERIPVAKLLKLKHPQINENEAVLDDLKWTAMDICDAWAEKRGFFTAKASRNDTYRAANNILRMALEGTLCLCLTPPNYRLNKEKWRNNDEIAEIKAILARHWKCRGDNEEDEEDNDERETIEEQLKDEDDDEDESDADNVSTNEDKDDSDDEQAAGTSFGAANKFAVLAE